jgi:hypothetical protein
MKECGDMGKIYEGFGGIIKKTKPKKNAFYIPRVNPDAFGTSTYDVDTNALRKVIEREKKKSKKQRKAWHPVPVVKEKIVEVDDGFKDAWEDLKDLLTKDWGLEEDIFEPVRKMMEEIEKKHELK